MASRLHFLAGGNPLPRNPMVPTESQVSTLCTWLLASCWQCWVLGTDFGKMVVAKYDVICNYGPCFLACSCSLSDGMISSGLSLEPCCLLMPPVCITPECSLFYALLCFLWEMKPDEMKGQVWSQTDTVGTPQPGFLTCVILDMCSPASVCHL